MNLTHRWVATLVNALEAEVDRETRERIQINCGRSCISRSFVKKAQRSWKKGEPRRLLGGS